jgi:hypothetical protein
MFTAVEIVVPTEETLGCVISGFCRDIDEICAHLGYYAAFEW